MIAPSQFISLTSTLDPVFPRSCPNTNSRGNSNNLSSQINRYSSLYPCSNGFNCNASTTLIIKDLISSMQSPNGPRNIRRYQC
ncbi:hypothetical protein U3516DRAFT_23354 [Neocallimastix sp. 'constans']